ncbi:MAG TPA: ATP-binding protein [Thermoleophilia bacterium]|nr:ATP-binding protein [Thermoleophilia bacterium]
MERLRRLPIRLRLALAFALAMGLVLVLVGFFVYEGVSGGIDRSISAGLTARAGDISALIRQADSGLQENAQTVLGNEDESFAQVLDLDGTIVDTTPQLLGRPILSPSQVARVANDPVWFERVFIAGMEDPARLLAVPVHAQDRSLVVVAGTSLEGREETLSQLLTRLMVGGPIALFLTSLLAYGLAAAALRPVESMRREAAVISAAEPGRRLPVPPSKDELARLGTTLNEMLVRLEAAMARERSFVSDASHELRTPLSVLKTELELALSRERSAEELRDAVRSAAAETDRLAQLAEDLLVLARSDQGRLQIRSQDISAIRLLGDVRDRFERRARDAERCIVIEAAPDLEVKVDRLRMEQALANVVENALRHGEGLITLQAKAVNGDLEIHSLDEGPGFSPNFLPRAFERFTRSDESRSGGGAGLGLAIAAAIVEAHGGSMGAANSAGGGAEIWVVLPGLVR